MSTFCAVDDAALISLINAATKRIVFIAPGVHEPVAKALGKRLLEMENIHITVVLDADEDVCRVGYGDAKGLQLVNESAQRNGFWVKSQPGLRVGVLLADEQTLIWSPTPRSVEAPPNSEPIPSNDLFEESAPMAPNGLLLGVNPDEQIAQAVVAEGTNADPKQAEIGQSAITPQQVEETILALEKNPPIPVDLARITRVFSTKLQFVELKVKRAKLSRMQLTVSNQLLNADVKSELQGIIESKLRAFADLRGEEVEVLAFLNGEPSCDNSGKQRVEMVTEASLERVRHDIEKRFIYDIGGFGRLIAKDDKIDFEKRLDVYKTQLMAHSKALREHLDQQATVIINEAVDLIMARAKRATGGKLPDPEKLREELKKGLDRAKGEEPEICWVFKDVTFEQTKNPDFRARLDKALPASKRKQLGKWDEHFDAAKSAVASNP